jgi:hypothetical protein
MASTPTPTHYCTYCNVTLRKSYKSQHENTKKHRAAVQNDAQVRERRRKYVEERQAQTDRVVEILGKLTIVDKRFIVKNQVLFMECLSLCQERHGAEGA